MAHETILSKRSPPSESGEPNGKRKAPTGVSQKTPCMLKSTPPSAHAIPIGETPGTSPLKSAYLEHEETRSQRKGASQRTGSLCHKAPSTSTQCTTDVASNDISAPRVPSTRLPEKPTTPDSTSAPSAASRADTAAPSSAQQHPPASPPPAQPISAAASLPCQPAPKIALPRFRPGSFYPTNRMQQVEDRILRFLANVQSRLAAPSGPCTDSACWETFPLQQPAFDFADSHNAEVSPSLRVFSVELGAAGSRRRFLATSYSELWRRYRGMLPQHRHFYEIIRQGWPCHLYFDLEFAVPENPGVNGEGAVDVLLGLVGEVMGERFGLALDPSWVLELDSSTPAKFSRHLVVRVPQAAFASNAHAGAFVREVCLRALERRDRDPSCPEAQLFVNKGEGEALFVDLGVYTRNRAFRLYLSSKAGRDAVLQCTGRFGGGKLSQQEVFFRGLICHVDASAALLRCFDDAAGTAVAGGGAAPGTAGAALRRLGAAAGACGGAGGERQQVRYGPSPFPELEDFIVSVCGRHGPPGGIRSWALLEDDGGGGGEAGAQNPGGLVLYNVRGNRWCGHVGREHKSNGVFYVVDLQQGWWCQRCYDPDCRSFRSPLTSLPQEVLSACQSAVARSVPSSGLAPPPPPAAAPPPPPVATAAAPAAAAPPEQDHGQQYARAALPLQAPLFHSRQPPPLLSGAQPGQQQQAQHQPVHHQHHCRQQQQQAQHQPVHHCHNHFNCRGHQQQHLDLHQPIHHVHPQDPPLFHHQHHGFPLCGGAPPDALRALFLPVLHPPLAQSGSALAPPPALQVSAAAGTQPTPPPLPAVAAAAATAVLECGAGAVSHGGGAAVEEGGAEPGAGGGDGGEEVPDAVLLEALQQLEGWAADGRTQDGCSGGAALKGCVGDNFCRDGWTGRPINPLNFL